MAKLSVTVHDDDLKDAEEWLAERNLKAMGSITALHWNSHVNTKQYYRIGWSFFFTNPKLAMEFKLMWSK